MENGLGIVFGGTAVLVGFDSSDVRGLSSHEILDKRASRSLDETENVLVFVKEH